MTVMSQQGLLIESQNHFDIETPSVSGTAETVQSFER